MTQKRLKNTAKKIILEKGLRSSRSRLIIVGILLKNNHALSIEEIQKNTNQLDLSTIYRSLKSLVDAGIVYQTDFRVGRAYFELINNALKGHYIVCQDCKLIEKVPVSLSHQKETEALKKSKVFGDVSGHMLEFFGACKECLKKR